MNREGRAGLNVPIAWSVNMSPLLIAHVGAAFIGLLAGVVALYVRKAGRVHRGTGTVFSVAILVTTAVGAYLAAMQPARLSVVSATLTFYLVATGWAAVKQKERSVGFFEYGALFVGLGVVAAGIVFASQAAHGARGRLDGIPPVGYLVFGSVAALAAIADIKMIVRGGVSGVRRMTRHLWRMCTALWISAASFFLGQQKVMPEYMQGSPYLFIPEILILGVMIFWLIRVRRSTKYEKIAVAS